MAGQGHGRLIGGGHQRAADAPAALRTLKAEDGPDIIVWGSGTLIQTLLREKLVDRMHVWTHPVTIGTGKRLFADGTAASTWKLTKGRVGEDGHQPTA
jgi:dihydrofolate reductase